MKRKKVVVVQQVVDEAIKALENSGFDVVIPSNIDQSTLLKEFKDAEGVLARTAIINQELIESATNLLVIARAGVGYDNIDVKAATQQGVYVSNTPNANSVSVAEHVVGLILGLAHQIYKSDKALRDGNFDVRHVNIGTELKGKTLGIIGFGNIGKSVAQICVNGFDMKVIAYDPYITHVDGIDNVSLVDSIDKVLSDSDFITLHLPYLKEMHHFINEDSFKKMKKTAYFVNCARGGLVDEEALYHAIKNQTIAGAALDVFEQEPTPNYLPLWELENIIVTPHSAALTKEAIIAMQVGAAEEIIRVLNGEKPKNPVNTINT